MVKQVLLSVIFVLVILSLIAAGSRQSGVLPVFNLFPDAGAGNDTLPPEQSENTAALKYGFKDLFIHSYPEEGIRVEHLNPKAIQFVDDYIKKHSKHLEAMKGWGKPYFDMMDAILSQHGLPRELKYLAVIESHLKASTVSWAGAVGPWQFMPATAKRFGLKVSRSFDERTNYVKSTHAAASYLTELYGMYNDWLLVIAAYNGGPGVVNNAIKRSRSNDFWTLQNFLPAESRTHVKKFIATHFIMEGQGGITTLTKSETRHRMLGGNQADLLTPEDLANSKLQSVSGRYHSVVLTKHISMDILDFNRMNPDFDKIIGLQGQYELRLPHDKMELFLARKTEILSESIKLLMNSAGSPRNTPGNLGN
jgi:membrane-bound lytic murein transglycosylase D